MARTIVLKGSGIRKESQAAAGITPGHLIERASATTVQAHSTAAGNAAPSFAVENELEGKDIDHAYVSGERVQFDHVQRGAEVNALVAAGAAAIGVGAYLESAGDGTLRVVSSSAATSQAQRAGIVARALEAVDNSGGGSAVRIKVEVL